MIGDRIKELVSDIGGPKEMSAKTGIMPRTLSTYVSNKSQPGADNLAKIAKATGVDCNWLLLGGSRDSKTIGPSSTSGQTVVSLFNLAKKYSPLVDDDSAVEHQILEACALYNGISNKDEGVLLKEAEIKVASNLLRTIKIVLGNLESYAPEPEEKKFHDRQLATYRDKAQSLSDTITALEKSVSE